MIKCILIIASTFCIIVLFAQESTQSSYDLLKRVMGESDLPIELQINKTKKNTQSKTYFDYHVIKGKLHIMGSSNVALCRGFYDFVKSEGLGIYSWSGSNIKIPSKITSQRKKYVESPFKHHFYFNVVTYGYSMPYWDWIRWEKEIDWMALHGIDMPLALVAYEAIIARVWKEFGLTDEEINAYFVGPAHLPWMRMGNISGIDGPLNSDWHVDQIALQHKILDRMKGLGMSPICPGFAGFVPKTINRVYPKLEVLTSHWGGAFNNWMISPQEELYGQMATAFIKAWEKEFGANKHYLVDSFNEMDVPFPEKGTKERYDLAASYGEKVYASIKNANSDAIWAMQGWMFGYQRHIWDYETLEALVSKVPDDKMLLLDLAVDYNKHFWKSEVNWEYYKGFYNKPWVYSVIPNMGGKTGMTGILDFYANGHLEALSSSNKGRLIAHGAAPEGIENNEVIYELLADAGWSNSRIDVSDWLNNYSLNRYGSAPKEIQSFWKLLRESVYGSFTDHPRYNWQLRPGSVNRGTINIQDSFFKGIELFASVSNMMNKEPLYQADLAEFVSLYLGGKAEILVSVIDKAYIAGDTLKAVELEKDFEKILISIDRLLSTHPTLRLENWIDFAKQRGVTDNQKKQYEKNAKRIVAIWGPPVDDYSARIWSGLVRDYYYPRWKNYFESRRTSVPFDFAQWEKEWVENSSGCSSIVPVSNLSEEVNDAIAHTSFITMDMLSENDKTLGSWIIETNEWKSFVYNISVDEFSEFSGFKMKIIKGEGEIVCGNIELITDGVILFKKNINKVIKSKSPAIDMLFNLPKNIRANNGCQLKISLLKKTGAVIYGDIEMK